MISNFGDMRDQIIVRLGIQTTSAYYTEAILNNWINSAYKWSTSYKKWPFSEGRVSTTYSSAEEWSFEGYKADSFRIVQIGGKRLKKLNFEDYQIFRETQPQGDQRVFSDYGRTLFINPYSGLSGTLTAYGQYFPIDLDVTDLTARTIFSDGDEDGNEAIIEEVIAYANTREKKSQEALLHHQRAMQILDSLWERSQDEKYKYQTDPSRGGMFERFDVLRGGITDEIFKRDQF